MTKLGEMKRSTETSGSFDLVGKIKQHKMKLIVAFLAIIPALLIYAPMHVNAVNNSDKKVVVQYYFSYACGVCERTTPEVEAAAEEFGDRVELQKKCVTLINESSTNCILEQGLEQYERNMVEVRVLGAAGTPIFLFDRKMINRGMDKEGIRQEICNALYGFWGIIDLSGSKIEQCR